MSTDIILPRRPKGRPSEATNARYQDAVEEFCRAPKHSNIAERLPKPPEWRRIGHIQRQIRRAFIANGGKPLTTSELAKRCYPRLAGLKQNWRRAQIRLAAERWAVRLGVARHLRGKPIIWAPKPGIIGNQSDIVR
jgi:hypothetical protein